MFDGGIPPKIGSAVEGARTTLPGMGSQNWVFLDANNPLKLKRAVFQWFLGDVLVPICWVTVSAIVSNDLVVTKGNGASVKVKHIHDPERRKERWVAYGDVMLALCMGLSVVSAEVAIGRYVQEVRPGGEILKAKDIQGPRIPNPHPAPTTGIGSNRHPGQ